MRIIVGISGASGVIIGYHLLMGLRHMDCEIHLVVTQGAKTTWRMETGRPLEGLEALANSVYSDDDLTARISSGSFQTDGMIVVPCSMKTLSAIASGYAANLLVRAADVCLKEGRKVVLAPRETPLGKIHLRNLSTAAELGCAIVPPMLTFYNSLQSLEDQIHHVVGKLLMQFGLDYGPFVPWKGEEA